MVLYVDNGNTKYVISIDGNTVEFTPVDVDSIPLRAADFQGVIPLIPTVVYTDGTIYIVAIRVGAYADSFSISVNAPSGVTINHAWEVITHEQ